MALPGVSDESELKRMLKRLFDKPTESLYFAAVASAPKEGLILLDKKQKFKLAAVRDAAEADAKSRTGKAVKMDVMVGECRRAVGATATLRLIITGKASAKAVSCTENLLTRGPYKTVGFEAVLLEEVEEKPESSDGSGGGKVGSDASPPQQGAEQNRSEKPKADDVAARKTRLSEELRRAKDLADKLLDAQPDRRADLFGELARLAALVKNGQLDDAEREIGQFATGLQTEVNAIRDDKQVADQAAFDATRERLEPVYLAALRARPEQRANLAKVWEYAVQQASDGNLRSAAAALQKLEAALAQSGGQSKDADRKPEANATVAARRLVLAWSASTKQAIGSLEGLRNKLLVLNDPRATVIAKALNGRLDRPVRDVQRSLEGFADSLSTGSDTADATANLAASVDSCIAALKQPLILDAEANPFVKCEIRRPLLATLVEVRKVLAAQASA